jgi:hypothetical protein
MAIRDAVTIAATNEPAPSPIRLPARVSLMRRPPPND